MYFVVKKTDKINYNQMLYVIAVFRTEIGEPFSELCQYVLKTKTSQFDHKMEFGGFLCSHKRIVFEYVPALINCMKEFLSEPFVGEACRTDKEVKSKVDSCKDLIKGIQSMAKKLKSREGFDLSIDQSNMELQRRQSRMNAYQSQNLNSPIQYGSIKGLLTSGTLGNITNENIERQKTSFNKRLLWRDIISRVVSDFDNQSLVISEHRFLSYRIYDILMEEESES